MRRLVLDDSMERLCVFAAKLHGCCCVSTYEAAIKAFKGDRFDEVYLDHDLGTSKNGCDVAYWMTQYLPKHKRPGLVVVHSWNMAGAAAIRQTLELYGFNVRVEPFKVV